MKLKLSAAAALIAVFVPLAAHADLPGDHPYYIHALSDLRDARWNLEHRAGDAAVSANEDVAIVGSEARRTRRLERHLRASA